MVSERRRGDGGWGTACEGGRVWAALRQVAVVSTPTLLGWCWPSSCWLCCFNVAEALTRDLRK